MIKSGPAKKLTIYVDETDKHKGLPLYEVLMELFYSNKISGVTVFRGVAGYGMHRVLHTSKMLELSTTLPLKIEAVDTEAVISKVLPEVSALVKKGLVEISDTVIVNSSE
ncbi:MAG: DUF190 domain-containing protein [Nitrospirae bacterium]|nr:DUF190 domain-containing protein [Nitrospirota bacterium]